MIKYTSQAKRPIKTTSPSINVFSSIYLIIHVPSLDFESEIDIKIFVSHRILWVTVSNTFLQ